MTKPESDSLEDMVPQSSEPEFRVGRKVGRTIYRDDELVGMMDTPELATLVVDTLNGWMGVDNFLHDSKELHRLRAAVERIENEMRAHRRTWLPAITIIDKWADTMRAAREPNRPQEET